MASLLTLTACIIVLPPLATAVAIPLVVRRSLILNGAAAAIVFLLSLAFVRIAALGTTMLRLTRPSVRNDRSPLTRLETDLSAAPSPLTLSIASTRVNRDASLPPLTGPAGLRPPSRVISKARKSSRKLVVPSFASESSSAASMLAPAGLAAAIVTDTVPLPTD